MDLQTHVAEDIFFRMINEAKVAVYFQQRLAAVSRSGRRLAQLIMEDGKVYRARMFLDATYEGDLMKMAGVSYTVGREANAQYGETLDGVRPETPKHQFSVAVDPYLRPGDSASGLLPWVQAGDDRRPGEGDRCVQAYNYRLCYTQIPANRLPHRPPPQYDPARYELLARYLEALVAAGRNPRLSEFWNPIWMPNGKTDINNNGGFSTDCIGANYDYPEAGCAQREGICRAHEDYIRGFVYFLATSPRVPEAMRAEMRTWGPAVNEFPDTGGWPHQLYVREARRMVSDYVMSEHNCRGQAQAAQPVGLAAYTMDSHNCRRLAKQGRAENEGNVQVGGFPPYPINYRSIVPGRRVRKPPGAGLPVRNPHRLRLDPDGAGFHDPGPIGRHRRVAGPRAKPGRASGGLRAAARPSAGGQADPPVGAVMLNPAPEMAPKVAPPDVLARLFLVHPCQSSRIG